MKLPTELIQSLKTFPKLWIALSGGVDSVVLFDLLCHHKAELPPLQVIHVHHGLSPYASTWQRFCQKLSLENGLDFYTENVAIDTSGPIEEQARIKRYGIFEKYVKPCDALVLAHHLDDQIETFFLHALRGTGIDGLAAMTMVYPKKEFTLIRPLLNFKRREIEDYARFKKLIWIEDESNFNTNFYRNFLRQEVLPLIEKKWKNYRDTLSHTIAACQEVSDYLNGIEVKSAPLDLKALQLKDDFEQSLILRKWFRLNHLKLPSRKLIETIKQQMIFPQRPDHQAQLSWSGAYLYEYRRYLYLVKDQTFFVDIRWENFPQRCQKVQAQISHQGLNICLEKDVVEIRYRKGGEQFFWQGHHRCLKKLLQKWGVPPFSRNQIPLIYVNGILKSVVGYATLEEQGDVLYNIFCVDNTVCK